MLCKKETNPRKGIETCCLLSLISPDFLCKKETNPRKGIETWRASNIFGVILSVRKKLILGRGLKHCCLFIYPVIVLFYQ